METSLRFALVRILAGGALLSASAQVTLTRVLEGDIAEDTGYFWRCGWGGYDQDGNVDLFVSSSPATLCVQPLIPARSAASTSRCTWLQV